LGLVLVREVSVTVPEFSVTSVTESILLSHNWLIESSVNESVWGDAARCLSSIVGKEDGAVV
jgi:hypothetical protein